MNLYKAQVQTKTKAVTPAGMAPGGIRAFGWYAFWESRHGSASRKPRLELCRQAHNLAKLLDVHAP